MNILQLVSFTNDASYNFFYANVAVKGIFIIIHIILDFPNLETLTLGKSAFCNAGTAVFESR